MTTETTRKPAKRRRAKKKARGELLTPAAVAELAVIRDVEPSSVERRLQYHADQGKVDGVRIMTKNGRRFWAFTFEDAIDWLREHGFEIKGDAPTGAVD